jgi:hypothetical protein
MKLSIYNSANEIQYWWCNFIDSLNITDITGPLYFLVEKALKLHNAILISDITLQNNYIEFENEEYATLFLLKFS